MKLLSGLPTRLKISVGILTALIITTALFPELFAVCGILAAINGAVALAINHFKYGHL